MNAFLATILVAFITACSDMPGGIGSNTIKNSSGEAGEEETEQLPATETETGDPESVPSKQVPAGSKSSPKCDTEKDPIVETDLVVDLGNGRPTLLVSWLPRSLTSANPMTHLTAMVKWADASMCSPSPAAGACQGLISLANGATAPQDGYLDMLVVTRSMLVWFDRTARGPMVDGVNTVPNGGGGLARGIWMIKEGTDHALWFDAASPNDRAFNLLLPGATFPSPGTTADILQGGGLSLFWTTTDVDNGVTNNLENDPNALMTRHGPASAIESADPSLFLLQTRGHFVGMGRYLDGIQVLATNRISGCDRVFSTEFLVTNTSTNAVGPLRALSVAANHFGSPVDGFRFADQISFAETKPETCLVVTRGYDTPVGQCEATPFSFFERFVKGRPEPLANLEIAVQSKPHFDIKPPTFMLSMNKAKPESHMKIAATKGFLAARFIFDTHSSGGAFVVPSWDGPAFSASDCESADSRVNLNCEGRLPAFVERRAGAYYFKAGVTSTMLLDLSFDGP